MVTIKDIAKRANVSISTVSYALNGNPIISEETRERVLSIAKELDYVPNGAARNLKRKKSEIIGIFLSTFSGSFYSRLIEGMEETLFQAGYSVVVCNGRNSQRLLEDRMLDGAIILDHDFSDEMLMKYTTQKQPIVVLDRKMDNNPLVSQVLLDNEGGIMHALEYSYARGFRFFYILTGPAGTHDADMRFKAAKDFFSDHPEATYEVVDGDFTKRSGARAAAYIVSKGLKDAAIISFNDEMVIGMYDYFNQTTYAIGEDIHVIGFDNIELSGYLNPRLTTINYSLEDWGKIAAKNLLALIAGKKPENQIIYTSIVEGGSMGRIVLQPH